MDPTETEYVTVDSYYVGFADTKKDLFTNVSGINLTERVAI